MSKFGSVVLVALLPMATTACLADRSPQKPEESRFTVVSVVGAGILDEPMSFEVLRDGTVYVAERKGRLMMYDPRSRTTSRVDSIAVNHTYVNASGQASEAEEGLVGFTLDPGFEQNHWAYFLYAHPTESRFVLSRMELRGPSLLKSTERILLEVGSQRETCCHTGGGMTWDGDGNLYVTVGNNTGNVAGSQTDQRDGRTNWDDQRGSANTNDLRGKILRIHPEPDGTYTIPAGNLFPPGTSNTRQEIYAMGLRNPWRVSVDSRSGYVYWGEVGPDAPADTAGTVAGEDELNQARGPGYFGWPYFIGANRGFPITDYETCAGTGTQERCSFAPPKDPTRPVNDSRWNTGLRELPAAQPAFISYPYAPSERFPEVGTGARSAVGGPIYRRADRTSPARPWPAYYEGRWIVSDLARGWIMSIRMDERGDYLSMERFLPAYRPIEPIDLKFGHDGDLYVLEYGSIWFGKSPDSRLVRIEYNAGNRAPEVELASDARGGAVPFTVALSAEGTRDPDQDPLTYEWRVGPAAGGNAQTFTDPDPSVTLENAGVYEATLTVRDPAGAVSRRSLRLVAGNEPPRVEIEMPAGNRTFFFPGRPLAYAVRVTDREDAAGVAADRVAFSIDYVPETFDVGAVPLGDTATVTSSTRFAVAQAMMAASDCRVCHQPDSRSVGPTFRQIATRYQASAEATARLVQSIRGGSTGRWGEVTMPAHPALSVAEATALARYVLAANSAAFSSLPLTGHFTPEIPEGDPGRGRVVIRAAYTDRAVRSLPPQTSERTIVLRSPVINAGSADVIENADTRYNRGNGYIAVIPRDGGYVGLHGIDLTGVGALELVAAAVAREGNVGGTAELRLDSPTGTLLGRGTVVGSQQSDEPTATQIQEAGGVSSSTPAQPSGTRIRIPLPPTTGTHDVYLVFRNPRARERDPLFTMNAINVLPR